jgi:hypothetical protein
MTNRIRPALVLSLSLFTVHCGGTAGGDGPEDGNAVLAPPPPPEGRGPRPSPPIVIPEDAAPAQPTAIDPKASCSASKEIGGPLDASLTRSTTRDLRRQASVGGKPAFGWWQAPINTNQEVTSHVAVLGPSGWAITTHDGAAQLQIDSAGDDVLSATIGTTVKLSRNGAAPFASFPVAAIAAGTSARVRTGSGGHYAIAWHDGAALHVGRIAPNGTTVTQLPTIGGANPGDDTLVEIAVSSNGDGFVIFRKEDGSLAVRGWQGTDWAGDVVVIPDTGPTATLSETVALPGGHAFVYVRDAQRRGVILSTAPGLTKVAIEPISALSSLTNAGAVALAGADGEITLVTSESDGSASGRRIVAVRRSVAGIWSSQATVLSAPISAAFEPAAAIDGDGHVTTAFRTEAGITHRRIAKGAATWLPGVTVATTGIGSVLSSAIDVQLAIEPKTHDPIFAFGVHGSAGYNTTIHEVRCQ